MLVEAGANIALNALTPDEENAKALNLIVPVLGTRKANALLAALGNREKFKDVRGLRKL